MHKQDEIRVWENPASKIQFMESVFKGKDWQTTLVYPRSAQNLNNLKQVKQTLESRGYLTQEGQDDSGNLLLRVHHTGKNTDLLKVIQDHGLSKGLSYSMKHPGVPLSYVVTGLQNSIDSLDDVLKSPPRITGLAFIAAESFLALSGLGNKHGKFFTPHNFLQSLAGTLFLSQSLLFLGFGKSDDERAFNDFRQQFEKNPLGGNIDTAFHSLNAEMRHSKKEENDANSLGGKAVQVLRDYPIQIGGLLNSLGMLAYMGHAIFYRKYFKTEMLERGAAGTLTKEFAQDANKYIEKTFKIDMARATVSFFGWLFLLYPRKEHPEKSSNPIINLFQQFEENPQVVTGLSAIAGSTTGLRASLMKGNNFQAIGESIYIPGDLFLLFTHSDEYGKGKDQGHEKLAEAVAQFIEHSPFILGPQTREIFTKQVSEYLAEKTLRTQLIQKHQSPDGMPAAQFQQEVAKRGEEIYCTLSKHAKTAKLHSLENFAEASARLVEKFPQSVQPQLMKKLADTAASVHGVYATKEELIHAVQEQLAPCHKPKHLQGGSKLIQMKDISREVANLVFTLPGLDAGANASLLYDALAPFTRSQASDQHHLHQAMTAKAYEQAGTPDHLVPAQYRQQLEPQGPARH